MRLVPSIGSRFGHAPNIVVVTRSQTHIYGDGSSLVLVFYRYEDGRDCGHEYQMGLPGWDEHMGPELTARSS